MTQLTQHVAGLYYNFIDMLLCISFVLICLYDVSWLLVYLIAIPIQGFHEMSANQLNSNFGEKSDEISKSRGKNARR